MFHCAGEAVVAETTLVVSRADVSGDLVHGARPRRRAAQSVAHRAGDVVGDRADAAGERLGSGDGPAARLQLEDPVASGQADP